MKEIAERIRQIRIERGLTQVELGLKIGMTGSGVSKIEHDTYEISLETAKKNSQSLECRP